MLLPCKDCITLPICKSVRNPVNFIKLIDKCSIILEYLGNPIIHGIGWIEWDIDKKPEDLHLRIDEINSIFNYKPKLKCVGG